MFADKAFGHIFGFFQNRIPAFCKNTFAVCAPKRARVAGALVFAVTMTAVLFNLHAYTSQTFAGKWWLLAFALVCPALLGLATACCVTIKNETFNRRWHWAFFLLMPVLTITVTECLNGIFIYDMTYLGFLGNYLLMLVLLSAFFALTGSLRVTYLVVNTALYALSLTHSYVMDFRGTPLLPMDFLGVKTAAEVAGTYNYAPTHKIMTASLVFIFIVIISIKTKTPQALRRAKVLSRSITGFFAGLLLVLFYATDVFTNMGYSPISGIRTAVAATRVLPLAFFATSNMYICQNPAITTRGRSANMSTRPLPKRGKKRQTAPKKRLPKAAPNSRISFA